MSIVVSGLTKKFGDQIAVNNISFEIGRGEIVGFLGPNGAGKSTTMRMLTGHYTPDNGYAKINGHDTITEAIPSKAKIGFLPEQNPLYNYMFVKEYLALQAGFYKVSKDRIEEVIQKTGLEKEAHKKIESLSKGYKQRVGIASALLHNPDVLILDEPTTGLDPNQLIEIRTLIKELGKRQNDTPEHPHHERSRGSMRQSHHH